MQRQILSSWRCSCYGITIWSTFCRHHRKTWNKTLRKTGSLFEDLFCNTNKLSDLVNIANGFNTTHQTITFMSEIEDNSLLILDVCLIGHPVDLVQRRVHHKATWISQYTNCHSFVLLCCKRNLMCSIWYRTGHICTADTSKAELSHIRKHD